MNYLLRHSWCPGGFGVQPLGCAIPNRLKPVLQTHKVSMILRLSTADENLLLLRNSLARIPGTARILLTCGDGASPRPNQLLSGTVQIRTSSPHGPFAARDQATSAEYQFGSGSSQLGRGNAPSPHAPSPHVSKMREVTGVQS